MPNTVLLSFFDKAEGESTLKGKEKWVQVVGWSWEIEAETSWTKGGGASVGKPNPGKLHWEHSFDTSSPVVMGYLCTGKAFPKVELQMMKDTGGAVPETYFTLQMESAFITKVGTSGSEDGGVVQYVEMVFKSVRIDYKPQDRTGKLGTAKPFTWDIPAGTASPSA